MDEGAFGVKITLAIFLASTKYTSGAAPRKSNILLFARFSFSFISLSIFYFNAFPQPFLSLRFHISFIANARFWSLYYYSSSLSVILCLSSTCSIASFAGPFSYIVQTLDINFE